MGFEVLGKGLRSVRTASSWVALGMIKDWTEVNEWISIRSKTFSSHSILLSTCIRAVENVNLSFRAFKREDSSKASSYIWNAISFTLASRIGFPFCECQAVSRSKLDEILQREDSESFLQVSHAYRIDKYSFRCECRLKIVILVAIWAHFAMSTARWQLFQTTRPVHSENSAFTDYIWWKVWWIYLFFTKDV